MSESEMLNGTVIWFDSRRGYGFVKPDNDDSDVFVHYSNITSDGFKTLKAEQRVSFAMGTNHRGPQCINVVLLDQ